MSEHGEPTTADTARDFERMLTWWHGLHTDAKREIQSDVGGHLDFRTHLVAHEYPADGPFWAGVAAYIAGYQIDPEPETPAPAPDYAEAIAAEVYLTLHDFPIRPTGRDLRGIIALGARAGYTLRDGLGA